MLKHVLINIMEKCCSASKHHLQCIVITFIQLNYVKYRNNNN